MKTFLEEVAEQIVRTHPRLDEVTVVFPNRRAALYFRKHLGGLIKRPVFSPRVLTIEDFIGGFSSLKSAEKITLISVLYQAYRKVMHTDDDSDTVDSLERFYFWGEMLLRDFDEVDKYQVPARQLFKDLSHQKELDSSFDFLTDEQKQFLREFWTNFDEHESVNKKRFVKIWRRLGDLYDQFRKDLLERGLAYEGMLHRMVAESLEEKSIDSGRPLVFAGFNALTSAEEKIITFFVEHSGAKVFWDADAYYTNNAVQEAGKFFGNIRRNLCWAEHSPPIFRQTCKRRYRQERR